MADDILLGFMPRSQALKPGACAGLLTSGILPAMRHCIQNLMADDMVVLPAAATVYCQAAEARTGAVCGFDLSAADRYRWLPAHTSGAQVFRPKNHKILEPSGTPARSPRLSTLPPGLSWVTASVHCEAAARVRGKWHG